LPASKATSQIRDFSQALIKAPQHGRAVIMGIMGHPNPKLLMLGELFEKRGGYILLIYIYG